MLKHAEIWAAIDRLARENGLTASGLARRAGLDPTTFNRSKRITREGKPRWPSTESISKILGATGVSLPHFVELVQPDRGSDRPTVRMASLDDLRRGDNFDSRGLPEGEDWDEVPSPDLSDPAAFALEVNGDELEPVYRDGDVLIVSPSAAPRRGDRVVVRTCEGDVMVGRLIRQTAKRIDIVALPNGSRRGLPVEDVYSVSRILWASQ